MADADWVEDALVEAGLLPRQRPQSYTFRKMREVLAELEGVSAEQLSGAVAAAWRLEVRGPLAVAIFIKHHLRGAHEAEVDRITESEDRTSFGVLVYPEGELPIKTIHLPAGTKAGSHLRYDPHHATFHLEKGHS